jgi:flagellar hook-basal body complex protein FliE
MPTPLAAAGAYTALAKVMQARAAPDPTPPTHGFAASLQAALGQVADAGRTSDAQAASFAAGKANILEVATAVAETEVAVEALVSVRDRVVSAYEEIMRMPI